MSQERGSDQRWKRLAGAAALCVLAASGCKSGMSTSKPSWWTLGGQGGDASKLASAPPFGDAVTGKEADVAKPSSLASPYPTTSTPDGYALNNAPSAQVAAAQPAQYPSTDNVAPITYGQPQPVAASVVPSATTPTQPQGTIAAQAGPYATLPAASSTAAQPTPAVVAQSDVSVPGTRFADNRASDAWAGSPAAASAFTAGVATPAAGAAVPNAAGPGAVPNAAAASPGESRYGQETGSRFGGSAFPNVSAPPSRMTEPTAPFVSESSTHPLTPSSPPTAPGATIPASPPRRRPDPGYRPGGTSSYRPSRSILVGEPMVDPAVRTAGFEAPAEPIRQ